MIEETNKLQKPSMSLVRMYSRLHTTREHLKTVDDALRRDKRDSNKALINHALTRNCELALQLLYVHLNEFLKSILSEMFKHKPLQIVDKAQGSLKYHEILSLGSYDAVCDDMVDKVFRKLQNERNSRNLVTKILENTHATVSAETLDDAMFYMEIRHLIVHNSSLMDKAFVIRYPSAFKDVKEGNKMPLSCAFAREGIKAVQKLCEEIDRSLVFNGYINSR